MSKESIDIKDILLEALEKKGIKEQSTYLESVCGSNANLRSEVESLLKAHELASDFLPSPDLDPEINLNDSPLTEGPGTIIDRYKLLEKLGEGGMAIVYMAEQTVPIRRKVALKIIKLGMDTKSIIARFEAERQALAILDHPNIAKVLDAGTTQTGRPYFVMELIKGVAITEYCDENNIDTRERLELFVEICRALEHAHQQGIIHRDIKPSNVMIALHDSKPVPKVIDFGIAKATQHRLTEKTLFTEFRQLIGTPVYMSPEQAEFGHQDIDTRTDIYSLGVLLYELLTGTTPFEGERFHSASYDEICRIIRDSEPLKPSTRLGTLGDKLTEVAACRHMEPSVLCKAIRGDLDWIVMKAIEKARNRRYDTAEELAVDIERHLREEPVLASPPSACYRLYKFIRRNRVAVITISLVIAALAVGATTATLTFLASPGSMGKDEHATGMTQRHVWNVPPHSSLSTSGVSSDGRYVSYVDWNAGNLAVYDVFANTNWHVTKNSDPTWKTIEGWCEHSIVSPEGGQIAYSWVVSGVNSYQLRLIDLDGKNMHVLHDGTGFFFVKPYAWSPDGKSVLTYFSDEEENLADKKTGQLSRRCHLALVSTVDGSVRFLKTWDKSKLPKMAAFSPDGRYVAYDIGQQDDSTSYDIFLVDLETTTEHVLIEHPSNDLLFGWALEGVRILFRSDRTSKYGLWVVDIDKGAPQGPPRLLKNNFDGQALGFTSDGSYYYGVETTASNVLVGTLDSVVTRFESEPALASSRYVGSATMADWSPDGSMLAYRASTSERRVQRYNRGNWALIVNSVQTGDEHIISALPEFRPDTRMWGPRWSPDGRSLLVIGTSEQTGYGMHSVDIQTGQVVLLRQTKGELYQAAWSWDGTSIFFFAKEPPLSQVSLRKLETATGQETELYSKPTGPVILDISPDGLRLAFWQNRRSIVVMPSTGGEPRQVLSLGQETVSAQVGRLIWMLDGEHLIYTECGDHGQLWKVHVETGRQERLGPPIKNLIDAAMHPDGRQIAFSVEETGAELWIMENFLSD